MKRRRTFFGRVIRGVGAAALTAVATAFPVAGGVVQRSAAAFRAGVQHDRKRIEETHRKAQDVVKPTPKSRAQYDAGTKLASIWLWITRNWYFILFPVLLFFVFRGSGRKSSGRKSSRKKSSGRESIGQGGFRKIIHGKEYTSKKAWADAMQRLRRKK